jgi:long-chain acyl-CoA synthetase
VVCEGLTPGYPALSGLGTTSGGPFQACDLTPSAPAAILYTSGTTGLQKGATLSHMNVVSNVEAVRQCLRIDPPDRLLLSLPLFHCFGQNFIMNAGLASAATLVMHRRFELDAIVASIQTDGVTMFFGVPTMYISMLNAGVSAAQLAGVRYYFSAAAALPKEVAQQWQTTIGRPIHEGYGLTETSPFATYNHEWDCRPGSQGTPIPLVQVKIVDENGSAVRPGLWVEICIDGPNVMLGYWNRPEDTADALRGGWFHTGDVGYFDEDGYLHIVDRTKDMINSAGFKVWPREVEEVLFGCPQIKECCVIGVPDPVKGEVAKAFIVLKPGEMISAEALEDFCRTRLAAYKIPRHYEFTSEIPKNATGKILKRVLRDAQFAVRTA